METFSALLAICAGSSLVIGEFPHNGQWSETLMFSLICAWINGWVISREAGDLRRHRAHHDIIVMNVLLHKCRGYTLCAQKCNLWTYKGTCEAMDKSVWCALCTLSQQDIEWIYRGLVGSQHNKAVAINDTHPKLPWLQGSWDQHGTHLGPTGSRWAPCWHYEPCYLGHLELLSLNYVPKQLIVRWLYRFEICTDHHKVS